MDWKLELKVKDLQSQIEALKADRVFLLFNLWRVLNWQHLAIPRRGGRYLDESLFRLQRFINFWADAICEICQPIRAVSRPDARFLKY